MLKVEPLYLKRNKDVSGISGEGIVAVGVKLPSGRILLEWQTFTKSISIFDSIDHCREVHGHEGATELIMGYPDDKPKKARKKKLE
jgi:hypothetical protein